MPHKSNSGYAINEQNYSSSRRRPQQSTYHSARLGNECSTKLDEVHIINYNFYNHRRRCMYSWYKMLGLYLHVYILNGRPTKWVSILITMKGIFMLQLFRKRMNEREGALHNSKWDTDFYLWMRRYNTHRWKRLLLLYIGGLGIWYERPMACQNPHSGQWVACSTLALPIHMS